MIYVLGKNKLFSNAEISDGDLLMQTAYQEINKAINYCLVTVTALLSVTFLKNIKSSMTSGNETFVTQITKLAERRGNCLGRNDKLCRKVRTKPINYRPRILN